MSTTVKFSSKIDKNVLSELKKFARESHHNISWLLTEAIREYLSRARIRPAFRKASEEVLSDNKELLERLAK